MKSNQEYSLVPELKPEELLFLYSKETPGFEDKISKNKETEISLAEKLIDIKDRMLSNEGYEAYGEYLRNLRDELLELGYDNIDRILEDDLEFQIPYEW